MKRLIILAVAVLTVLGSVNAEDNVNIGKSNIKLKRKQQSSVDNQQQERNRSYMAGC